jgi:hypothetical protein
VQALSLYFFRFLGFGWLNNSDETPIFAALDRNSAFNIPSRYSHGAVAQSVEQRTENPCVAVAGSIPAHTTEN